MQQDQLAVYIVCGLAFAYGVMNADPRVFVVSNFWVLIVGIGLYFTVPPMQTEDSLKRNTKPRE